MIITSAFDGGNIKVINIGDPGDIQLEIEPDAQTNCYQWFYFRLVGAKGVPCTMKLMNAAGAYIGAWDDYRAVASYDREIWRRIETTYHGEILEISLTPETNSVYIAYFAPYSVERQMDTIAQALNTGFADLEILGQTLDGQNLDLLTVGKTSHQNLTFWITARQHPGETMASWWMEGFLARLLDPDCPISNELRNKVRFFIVPNMNPDGSRRGHLRTNAAGVDLNRAWKSPSMEKSPEIYLVRNLMLDKRPDLSLDVHGTEGIRHVFIAGPEGPVGSKEPVETLVREFKAAMLDANRDFQTVVGFDTPSDDVENSIGTNYQGEVLQSLCMTLEMPFKDTSHTPDPKFGWSPKRAKQMGWDSVQAMLTILPRLHAERDAWR